MNASAGQPPSRSRRVLWLVLAAAIIVAVALFLAAAWSAGRVPGQPEATRIPVTPFADIPGFGAATPAP
ncbi:MAG: hypothetical protein ACKOWF_14785 [Chloroflexota bacterium]